MKIPKALRDLTDSFQKLPGIGPKSAQRLTYYLLHVPQSQLDDFAQALSELKKSTIICSKCKNVSETDPCWICADTSRDTSTILVVEQPLDLLAFDKTGKYKGLYHVLHGAIDPLNNIGPDELFIADLFTRIRESDTPIAELIVATNPTMEGDATALYIAKQIHEQFTNGKSIEVTRLGMGMPTGADVEYADETTLTQAIEGRRVI